MPDDGLEPLLEQSDRSDRYERGQIEPAAKRTEHSQHDERSGHHPWSFPKMRTLGFTSPVRAVKSVEHHPGHVNRGQQRGGNAEEIDQVKNRTAGNPEKTGIRQRGVLGANEGGAENLVLGEKSSEEWNA